jgi:hypothetical protein
MIIQHGLELPCQQDDHHHDHHYRPFCPIKWLHPADTTWEGWRKWGFYEAHHASKHANADVEFKSCLARSMNAEQNESNLQHQFVISLNMFVVCGVLLMDLEQKVPLN